MSKNCGPKFCNVGSNFSMEWQRKSSMGVKQNVILQILSVGGTVVEMDGDEMTRLVLIYVVGYFIFLWHVNRKLNQYQQFPFPMKKKCYTKTFPSMSYLATITEMNKSEQYEFCWFSGMKLITTLQEFIMIKLWWITWVWFHSLENQEIIARSLEVWPANGYCGWVFSGGRFMIEGGNSLEAGYSYCRCVFVTWIIVLTKHI